MRMKTMVAGVLLLAVLSTASDAEKPFRPPAVPLVTHDPCFSVWSPADRLTDAATTHWTGKPHPLHSLFRVDGQTFRVMGTEPAALAALPQIEVKVWPTRTVYRFVNSQIALTLTFLTPALPSDLDILARPVTYIDWDVRSADGQPHSVQVYFDAGPELAVNVPEQKVVWERPVVPGLKTLRLGGKDQRILAKKGDDLRIDWGYLYLAVTEDQHPRMAIARGSESHKFFAENGGLPSQDDASCPRAAGDDAPVLAASLDFGQVGQQAVSRRVILAYDDLYSIKYFRSRLRPYWRRDNRPSPFGREAGGGSGGSSGQPTADKPATAPPDLSPLPEEEGTLTKMLQTAARDYPALAQRCRKFDEDLMADLARVGGEHYALLCALAYRQTFSGNKLAADAKGMPLLFPKENFSNGCISTVDVLFPQAPFFLAFSPALTKAMLVPILDYAASPSWPYGYAPHDLGTYPHATGQVYGMGGGDGSRMPVEESGNMLIILAALAKAEGNADFSRKYWPTLTRWADYLVANGLDPENQLCSADMFGHLPHCANLALKAIIGIGGYAQLCERTGRPAEAQKYMAIARQYAAKWQELAKDDGRTRLAYHLPGTWGMKHNLIWDRVLGLGLFPDSVGDAEIAWYLKVQKKYGLPVDNRTPTSLIDWAVWSIAPAREQKDFQALLEPIFRYADETPSRVPLSDWFVTTDARRQGFQARPVVGGIFVKLLADAEGWKKWSQQAEKVANTWTEPLIANSGATKEIVLAAREAAVTWRCMTEKPTDDWHKPGFDDSAWKQGPAGFGTEGTPGAVVRTKWNGKDIWLRREVTLGPEKLRDPLLLAHCDEDGTVYLNGLLAAELPGWTTGYEQFEISPEAQATLRPGKNLLAMHCQQTYGGQYIDVGIVDFTPGAAPADPQVTLPPLKPLFDYPLEDRHPHFVMGEARGGSFSRIRTRGVALSLNELFETVRSFLVAFVAGPDR